MTEQPIHPASVHNPMRRALELQEREKQKRAASAAQVLTQEPQPTPSLRPLSELPPDQVEVEAAKRSAIAEHVADQICPVCGEKIGCSGYAFHADHPEIFYHSRCAPAPERHDPQSLAQMFLAALLLFALTGCTASDIPVGRADRVGEDKIRNGKLPPPKAPQTTTVPLDLFPKVELIAPTDPPPVQENEDLGPI